MQISQLLSTSPRAFKGFSLEGPFSGAWMTSDGSVYRETSLKLEVMITRGKISAIRKLFKKIGKQLGQRAIYFDVREGGEIIDLENNED